MRCAIEGALLLRHVKIGHKKERRPRCSPGEGTRGENELTRIGGLALTTLFDGRNNVLRPLPDFSGGEGQCRPVIVCFSRRPNRRGRSTEKKNNRRGGEDGKIRSRGGRHFGPEWGKNVTADRDRPNIRMASAKSRPEITRLPLEAIGAIAIYRIRAGRR